MALLLIPIGIGVLSCYSVYKALEKQWTLQVLISHPDILDEGLRG